MKNRGVEVVLSPSEILFLEILSGSTASAALDMLVDHAVQGVYRPGSWERQWLSNVAPLEEVTNRLLGAVEEGRVRRDSIGVFRAVEPDPAGRRTPLFNARRLANVGLEAVIHVLVDDVPAGVLAVPPSAVPALLERLTRGECAASAATCAWQFTEAQCCAREPSVVWYHQDGRGSAFYCTEHAAELARICWETLRKLHERAQGGAGQ